MYCANCKEENDLKSKYCWNCGEKIKYGNEPVMVSTGNNSINLGVGLGNEVKIGEFYAQINSNGSMNYVHYEFEKIGKPFNINKGKEIKNTILSLGTVGTLLGIISSILSIVNNGFLQNQYLKYINIIFGFSIIILVLGMAMHFIYKDLCSKGFIWLRIGTLINLKLIKEEDQIFRLKIDGICPKCNGNILLYKEREGNKIFGYCAKNPDHRYDFDYTDFSGRDIFSI